MRSRVAAPFPIPHTLRFTRYLLAALRVETVGGGIMLAAAAVALIWANSPWASTYEAVRAFSVGPEALHLHLDLATWAADGLLAVFFFVAGLEVKEEVVHGELRQPSKAVLPIVAAVAGMVVPAAVYLGVSAGVPGALDGWAIPTATDIAFALGVVLGLLLGKFLGVFGGVWVSVRLGFATLSEGLRWRDLAALSILAGVGFTVSLLIAELAYAGTPRAEHVKVAILLGSFVASVVAAILLRVGTRDRSGAVRHSGGA